MYKVMLVDDEILMRESIAKTVNWNSLGLELVATCENGKEAINIMEKIKIDILLTDICMPYVDGLELSKHIYEKKYKCKVIIITGYEDFQYAKKAIEYQVLSYVLKPITEKELVKRLKNVVNVIDEKKQITERIKDKVQYSIEELETLREGFFQQVLAGKLTRSNIREKEKLFDIKFRYEIFLCCVIYSNEDNDNNYFNSNIQDKIKEYINNKNYRDLICFNNSREEIVLLFNIKSNEDHKKISDICIEIKTLIENNMNFKIAILKGKPISSIQKVGTSFESAKQMRKYLYLENNNDFLDISKYNKINLDKHKEIDWKKYNEQLIISIKRNMKIDIENLLKEIVDECKIKWIKPSIIIMQFQKIATNIIDELSHSNIYQNEITVIYQKVISKIFESMKIEKTKNIIKEIAFYAADAIARNETSSGEAQVKLALEYIEKNFNDIDLSLQSMCMKLNVSVSYFSANFKEYTGTTFIEKLKNKRIENAKKLLSTSKIKSYKIAEMCGYSDSSYFRYVFKKEVGITPKEYYKKYYMK